MGLRGPKPVDVKELKFAAQRWAALLFGVRGGAPGVVERWGQEFSVALVDLRQKEKVEENLKKMEEEGWQVGWPLWPSPSVWEHLKGARSVKRMRRAITALREWRQQNANLVASDVVLRRLETDPRILLRAKDLPNYPGETKTNDDKRVLFFSKVLAGLELGLAPLTTTKRLSRWRCENYWKTVGIPYVASLKTGLPVHPKAHNLPTPTIVFRDDHNRVEVVLEHYAIAATTLDEVEQWYIEKLGSGFKRESGGAQRRVVRRKLSISSCDLAFIANEDGLTWVVAMQKGKWGVEFGLARIGKTEYRKLWSKGESDESVFAAI